MFYSKIFIAEREISEKNPPFVIPEIGINHGGSIDTAMKMVDAAHKAGAEVVKFQTHIPDEEMSIAAKQIIPSNADQSIYNIMGTCSLSLEEEKVLKDYTESKGMIFLSTPFSKAAVDRLEELGVVAYKIGSGECSNYPLVEYIAGFGKPIILSTGMNTLNQIRKSVSIIRKYGNPLALLHCTNLYPTPSNFVRLGGLAELKENFPDVVVGLSDHTVNNNAALAATALGACILERHFTDDKNREGPDMICSMDINDLKRLIRDTKEIHCMRGGTVEPTKEEKKTAEFAFATVVSLKPISKGTPFTEENIWVKRPGTGEINAEKYYKVLGKIATRDIGRDEHLTWSDIGEKLT